MIKSVSIFFILFLIFLFGYSQDWPDWRSLGRDGVWYDPGVKQVFNTDKLNEEWSVAIGAGYSGPTVADGKVYITDKLMEPEETEGILCFDEHSGEKVWEIRYNCEYGGLGYPAGPRASVVINEGKACSLGTMGHLYCLDAKNGDIIWKKDLNNEYKIDMPIWGIASAPLIYEDKIILQIGGSDGACIIALNKNNGEEIWKNLEDRSSYSAPVLIEKNNVKVVVVWTENNLVGMNPANGEVYWSIPWKIRMGMAIATPVLYKNYLFVSGFYNGSLLVDLGNDYTTAEIVWQRSGESERKTDALHCVMNTPVILDDYIYGVDSYGELRCLDLLTGDRIWENQTAVNRERWANIHFVQNEDITWMFNEQGELLVTKLSPKGFTEISRVKLIESTKEQLPRGVTWSHPAFANKHVYVRNDNKLVCVDLSMN